MYNKQKIKRIAQIAAESKTIPEDIGQFVLKCLNKQELKTFLHYYKWSLEKKRVYVTSASELSLDNLSQIKSHYKGKEVITMVDKNLGAGIKLQNDDLVVDFTFKKYITDTIEKLKN